MEVTTTKFKKKTALKQAKQNSKIQQGSISSSQTPFIYKIKQYQPNGIVEGLSFMLIRPPRFLYNQNLLVPSYKLKGKYQYQVFDPKDYKQEQLPFPISLYYPDDMEYVILYLHGNSSSRFQGYLHLSSLPQKVGLACFDFNGCGLRKQSKYITLGKNQSKQVDIAAKFLKNKGYKLVGWGRSMGSVSLLLSSEIDVMIADSPFSSLQAVCKQSSSGFLPKACCCIFHCFYPCVQCWIRRVVFKKSGMDPAQLEIIQKVRQIPDTKSIVFLAGENDGMIRSHHSQKLYQAFKGQNKQLIIFQGSHNSTRPKKVIKKCFQFIHKQLNIANINLDKYQIMNEIKAKQIKVLNSNRNPPIMPFVQEQFKKAQSVQLPKREDSSQGYLNMNETFTKQGETYKPTKTTFELNQLPKNDSQYQFKSGQLQEIKIEEKSDRDDRYDLPNISQDQYYDIEQKQQKLKHINDK